VEWYSPADIVEAARDVLGSIDLDPASCDIANGTVKASRIYTADDDGLAHDWRGNVFLNPPYRQPDIAQFAAKFANHAKAGDIRGIVLTNNCTDTRWFSDLASVATAYCFPRFRCRYWQPDRDASTALQGQVIVYAGPEPDAFCRRFATLGLVVRPWRGPDGRNDEGRSAVQVERGKNT
jgi:ParB family chromosome partitioning protein